MQSLNPLWNSPTKQTILFGNAKLGNTVEFLITAQRLLPNTASLESGVFSCPFRLMKRAKPFR